MTRSPDKIALRARYLFPVHTAPVADGVLTIDGGRIVAVGENRSGRPPQDLGNVALLPGLVNAHTHLEFSDLDVPLGQPGIALPAWIDQVVARRRSREPGEKTEDQRQQAVARGLEESVAAGTAAVGEIATPGWSVQPLAGRPIQCLVFLELLGLARKRIEPLMELAEQHVQAGRAAGGAWQAGLSPHAPYTVHPELLARVCRLSAAARVPVAMHLAESLEELELLGSGSGPLFELLSRLDAWDPTALPRGIRPLDYLHLLSEAHRALVIHGNYLTDSDIRLLAQHAQRMAVVYCPRTHAYFGHRRYPLAELLAAGARVALGTDSRASNPDLNLLQEMRLVARQYPELPPETILHLGTLGGAQALGLDHQLGSLEPGKQARLTTVPLPDNDHTDPYDLLFQTRVCHG